MARWCAMPCSLLFSGGFSEPAALRFLAPGFILVAVMIFWRDICELAKCINERYRKEHPAQEADTQLLVDGGIEDRQTEEAEQYGEASAETVNVGVGSDGAMLDQPSAGSAERNGGGQQDGGQGAAIPERGGIGILDDAGEGGSAESIAVSGETIHELVGGGGVLNSSTNAIGHAPGAVEPPSKKQLES